MFQTPSDFLLTGYYFSATIERQDEQQEAVIESDEE